MAKNIFRKTAAEVETFGIDYTDRLSNEIITNDAIATSEWTVPAGITQDSDAIDQSDTRAVITLSGGTDGENYTLVNVVVTAGGRTLEEEIVIQVRD